MPRVDFRKLKRKGQCICCGKEIPTSEKVIRIDYPYISQIYGVSICANCMNKFYELMGFDCLDEIEKNSNEENE